MIEDYNKSEEIIELIKLYLDESLKNQEKERLERWLNESEENRALFQNISNSNTIKQRLEFRNNIKLDRDWDNINKRLGKSSNHSLIIRYAAVVLMIVGFASAIYFLFPNMNKDEITKTVVIEPGSSKAILTLAGGKQVALGNKEVKEIVKTSNIFVKDSVDELICKPSLNKANRLELLYNNLSVPRGGEYKLTLEDGTKVLLNSESNIRFPQFFDRDKRVIELTGEAYFEVKSDKSRPFIVKMNGMVVKVLGTKFNMKSYMDEQYISTTLVEGKVKVSVKGEHEIIRPGQQAYLDKNNKLKLKEVDLEKEIAWVKGDFIFENDRLEDVLRTLSRWYDIEVFYQNEGVKDYRFTGKLKRFADINEFLYYLEKVNVVDFSIKNRSILVRDIK